MLPNCRKALVEQLHGCCKTGNHKQRLHATLTAKMYTGEKGDWVPREESNVQGPVEVQQPGGCSFAAARQAGWQAGWAQCRFKGYAGWRRVGMRSAQARAGMQPTGQSRQSRWPHSQQRTPRAHMYEMLVLQRVVDHRQP